MSTEEKDRIKNTVWLWTAIGLVAGGCLGMFIAGYITGIIGAAVTGFMAYRGSVKANGGPPSWLWRSKKNKLN